MDMIFLKLLNMGLAAGWLILAILPLRILLKKAPKRVCCVLWGIAALRLVCPLSLRAPFSLIPSAEILNAHTVQYARRPTVNTGILLINRTLNPIISRTLSQAPGASVNPLHVWIFAAGILWAVGAVLLLCYGIFRYLRLRIKVREAVPFEEFSPSKNLWLCDAVSSPFILGLLKPRIFLPSGIGADELVYVTAHEQAHLQRKDHWWKWLGYLLLTVYWFHPLVWAAYVLFCRDLELACDEKVVRDFDGAEKKAYAHALVSCGMQRKTVLSCPLAFGEIDVKERVKTILNYKKPGPGVTAAASVLCFLLALCFLTDPPVSEFTGSRNGNDSEFVMVFRKFNATDSQNLTLEAGDVLNAAIILDDGRMAVKIRYGDAVIYDNQELLVSEIFDLEIAQSGIYTVEVTGEHARGRVSFTRSRLS